jgi:hypothetical protein
MLFLNLFCGPAFRTIELYDKALTILVLKLIDAVFVAV